MDINDLEAVAKIFKTLEEFLALSENKKGLVISFPKENLLEGMKTTNELLLKLFAEILRRNIRKYDLASLTPFHLRTKKEWTDLDEKRRLQELYNTARGNLVLIRGNGKELLKNPKETVLEVFNDQMKTFQVGLKVLVRNKYIKREKRK